MPQKVRIMMQLMSFMKIIHFIYFSTRLIIFLNYYRGLGAALPKSAPSGGGCDISGMDFCMSWCWNDMIPLKCVNTERHCSP